MADAISIIILILSIIAIPILVIITIIITKKKEIIEVEPNQPQITIFPDRKQFTDGYTHGILKRIKLNKNNTYLIEFYSDDVLEGGIEQNPELKSFIVHKDYIKEFGTEFSDRRRQIWILPRYNHLLPESLRGTETGNFISKETMKAYLKKIYEVAPKNTEEALRSLMVDYAGGNLSAKKQEEQKMEINKLKEILLEKSPRESLENRETKS